MSVAAFLVVSQITAASFAANSGRSAINLAEVPVATAGDEHSAARAYILTVAADDPKATVIVEGTLVQMLIVPAGFPYTILFDRGVPKEPTATLLIYERGTSESRSRLVESLVLRPSGFLEFCTDAEHSARVEDHVKANEALRQGFRELPDDLIQQQTG